MSSAEAITALVDALSAEVCQSTGHERAALGVALWFARVSRSHIWSAAKYREKSK